MVSELFFYQLGLIALVWLCFVLHWIGRATPLTCVRRHQRPHPQSARVSQNPLRASSTNHPATPVNTPANLAYKPP